MLTAIIRNAVVNDRDDIKNIYHLAFADNEREIVAKLAIDLLTEQSTPQTISLAAEVENSIVGHIAFSPVGIDSCAVSQGYILAPLAVHPDYQEGGIGTQLVNHGIQQLTAMGVDIVFVYGDPIYYSRFGFSADLARSYTAPYSLQYSSGWQVACLNECAIAEEPVAITCVNSLCDPKLW